MSRSPRAVTLLALVVVAVAAWLWSGRAKEAGVLRADRFTWVTTAHQRGVVGYRDPVGSISPDGTRVAYTEGRHVFTVPIGGGAPVMIAAAEGQVRQVTWIDANRLLLEQTGLGARWWIAGVQTGVPPGELWPSRRVKSLSPNELRQLAWSPDGRWVAAVASTNEGPQIWRVSVDGVADPAAVEGITGRPSSPAWTPAGDLACVVVAEKRARIAVPCGREPIVPIPDIEVVGPLAFSPDGADVYFASPNERGMVDLWSIRLATRLAERLTSFARDTYAPSVSVDGTVLFKTQSYRTFVAEVAGGVPRQLTTFQAETPTWHPRLPLVAVTYGTWRRLMDDANYPDIAQEIGLVDATPGRASAAPRDIVAQSESEDQAMTWSPNGKWVALHSHREMSDDVWLRPADGNQPDKRITFLGRGAEVGWPRWSPDGRTVLLDGASPKTGRSVIFTIGVDQDSGAVTSDLREIETPGFVGEITHAEWMPDSRSIAAVAREGPGRHVLLSVDAGGGPPRVLHRFETEHDFPGLSVSPDGRWLAFVAPAADGFFQIFRVRAEGGTPEQLTRDPAHKTQPAYAPNGDRVAYTVWSYQAQFWTTRR